MGAGSVRRPGTWRLAAMLADKTQGLVASPFAHLTEAQALFLSLPAKAGGFWLRTLTEAVPMTDATGKTSPCAAIAFTATGLVQMGLVTDPIADLATEFREGMAAPDRQHRLGDDNPETTLPGGWSNDTVHALLLLYESDDTALQAFMQVARNALTAGGVTVTRELRLSLHADPTADGDPREHFGFADGISQPVPHGEAIVDDTGAPYPVDPLHGIAAGDILIGELNAHGERAPGPLVPAASDPHKLLPDAEGYQGLRDFGRCGSYLVVRELHQDVAAFWTSMDRAGATIGQDADWVAARAVGRERDGTPLAPAEALPDPEDGDPRNDFAYFAHDRHGLVCPVGSHMRRANPRDGLAPDAGSAPDLLTAANNHRLLRRARKFGPPIADMRKDDGVARGLLFMALNTDLVRQFEFVQRTWMFNPGFGVLDESDPLLGPAGPMSIPARPFRLRPHVDTYIRLAGGDYFFLPGMDALAYLASL